MRRGNTAWALNYIAGPDAAIDYLHALDRAERTNSSGDARADRSAESSWPPHTFATTTQELIENVASAPLGVSLHAARIDGDGDAVVEATWQLTLNLEQLGSVPRLLSPIPPSGYGRFWVSAELVDDIARVGRALRRSGDLAEAITRLAGDT